MSKDQIAQARELDLLTYLQRYKPDELVRFSGNTYTTRSHDSLKISNGKWGWWSHGIGGVTALDYLVEVEDLSLPDAVIQLTGSPAPRPAARDREKPRPPPVLQLPPRHAVLRSTLPGSAFMGDVPGSDKRFSFAGPIKASSEKLCVFEGAIDALSYLTLIKTSGNDWLRANTISLSGVYGPKRSGAMKLPRAMDQYLKDNPQIETIILCMDNDDTGRMASRAIQRLLTDYIVLHNPPRGAKDYNDLLQRKLGC